jgi:hypothetical protein
MTNKEAAEAVGVAEPTARKYAPILGIQYYGTGQHKVYDWKKSDLEKLKKSIGKRGRPKTE